MLRNYSQYNFDFLNKYFTTKEFAFINNSNSENQKIEEAIAKQTLTRDFIIEFINNLNNLLGKTNTTNAITSMLTEVQSLFKKVNENISTLQELKDTSRQISDNIINLLIEIELHSNKIHEYDSKIKELKTFINDFSIFSEKIHSSIFLDDIKIKMFFTKELVKQYLNIFQMSTDLFEEDNRNIKPLSATSFEVNFEKKVQDSLELIISEKNNKVYLPYTEKEVLLYLEQYPHEYKSVKDVIKKEFIVSLDHYMKHPVVARFRETYALIRDRESKSIIDAFKYSFDLMFKYELNPAIIAACKTQEQLENYLECLQKGKLDDFSAFKIKFEVLPKKMPRNQNKQFKFE